MDIVASSFRHFKFKIFIIYGILMGATMGMLCSAGCFEISKALMYGIPFGCFMAIFFSKENEQKKSSTEQISADQDLVLNFSFLPIYLNTYGVFMFVSLMYILKLNIKEFDLVMAMGTAATMAVVLLSFMVAYPAQIIMGQRLIIVRRNFLWFGFDRIYDLQNAKKIKLSWCGHVVIKFAWGRKFVIPRSRQSWFSNLPQFEDADKTKKHTEALKIINWLEHKKKFAEDIDAKAECTRLKKIPRRTPSLGFISFSALIGLFTLGAPIFISSQISVMKIEHSKTKNEIFYKDVHNAFWLFDNPSRKMFETEWKTGCEQNLDYNCRLLSYLRVLESDQIDALSLVKRSCSHRDPFSCFNIILNEEATPMDIKLAEFQMKDICQSQEHLNSKYCACVTEGKLLKNTNCQKFR